MPQKGSVLISEPFLNDAYFQRAVIFLSGCDKDGAMGFVLNKETGLVLGDLTDSITSERQTPVFLGGPVDGDKLFFLHSLGGFLPGALYIRDDIYLNGDFDVLQSYMNQGNPIAGKIKFFLGYSGWSPGQLDEEIKSNTWLVGDLDFQSIMSGEREELWRKALSGLGKQYKVWLNYPKEPYLN
jgi:putative transcriptional regulator